jgi:hypothetical protein
MSNVPSAPPIYYLNQQSWSQQTPVQGYYNQQPQPAHIIYVQPAQAPPQRENTCLPVLQMFLCLCCLEECLFFNF